MPVPKFSEPFLRTRKTVLQMYLRCRRQRKHVWSWHHFIISKISERLSFFTCILNTTFSFYQFDLIYFLRLKLVVDLPLEQLHTSKRKWRNLLRKNKRSCKTCSFAVLAQGDHGYGQLHPAVWWPLIADKPLSGLQNYGKFSFVFATHNFASSPTNLPSLSITWGHKNPSMVNDDSIFCFFSVPWMHTHTHTHTHTHEFRVPTQFHENATFVWFFFRFFLGFFLFVLVFFFSFIDLFTIWMKIFFAEKLVWCGFAWNRCFQWSFFYQDIPEPGNFL